MMASPAHWYAAHGYAANKRYLTLSGSCREYATKRDNVKLDTEVTSTEQRTNMRAGRVQSITEVLIEMGYLPPDDGKMYDV